MNVLIAEDNQANQRLIEACCQSLNINATVVDDGAAALEAVRDTPYALVLMDVNMPRMDGIEATMKIRRLPGRQGQPLIFGLTGDMTRETRSACLAAGMQEVLPKPLRIPQLKAVIDRVRTLMTVAPNPISPSRKLVQSRSPSSCCSVGLPE